MNLILTTLKLIRALHDFKDHEPSTRSEVKLMPKTLEQLDDAIKEAISQCMVSVLDINDGLVIEIRLCSSEQSSEVLAEVCKKYGVCDGDIEIIKSEGFWTNKNYHISAIHLDSNGRYDQSPGEE